MQPAYEPVAGALVSGVDVQGQPLSVFGSNPQAEPNVAISQADGTYALFDLRYTGGPVTVAAIAGGTTRTATAYESNPQDTKSPGLRFARHLAVANVTFPAEAEAIVHAELKRGLGGLATIGSTAPFVGLFGTVMGRNRSNAPW